MVTWSPCYNLFVLVVTWLVTCACASLLETLHVLPKLATISVLCSWHVHCLGWVIWWLDRNRQGLLTGSLYMCVFLSN